MRRSGGFGRQLYVPAPPAPPSRGRVVSMGPAQLTAVPKPVEHRNPDLLGLARGRYCLLRIPGICCGRHDTVVACHSNSSDHGKGGARKADDQWTVWGCWNCHCWLDQGPADYREKNRAFSTAHILQIEAWARIAYDMAEPPRARRAAEWALRLLVPPQ